jgi:RND family efflux transporter MFP subunit
MNTLSYRIDLLRRIAYSAVTLLAIAATGCDADGSSHESGGHAHDEEGGHVVHGDHPESARPSHVVTLFGEHTELFVEFPAFVAGSESKFHAHFTRLDDYQPVRKGSASVILSGPDSPGERWDATEPARPGIFTPTATPKYTGERTLILVLKTPDFTDRFDLGELTVFESISAASKVPVDHPEGEISFLKELQWKVDFDVAEVSQRALRPSVSVNARIRPASDGDAAVTAPFDGRIIAPSEGVPQVGQQVEAGEVVGYVVPRLGAGEISQLRSELRKAQVRLARAEREVQRVEGLVNTGALPSKRMADAASDRDLAEAEVNQSQQRLSQYQNLESRGGGANGRVVIRSPIAGTVAERTVVDGAFVTAGDQLLRIVDRSQLWLEAHVPEAELSRLGKPTGAWFDPGEFDPGDQRSPVSIDVNDGGELVSFSEIIDPTTRTAPLIFALGQAAQNLRVGAFVKAHIFNGQPREVVTIPTSAVLDEKGLDVVFVMKGGESFERRTVRLGIRDRGMVEILDGVVPGEHVVSEGVYYVKLAGTSTGSVGHGHAH